MNSGDGGAGGWVGVGCGVVGVGTPAGVGGPLLSPAIGEGEPVVSSHSRHSGQSGLLMKALSSATIVSLQNTRVRSPEDPVASPGESLGQLLVTFEREWESPPEYSITNED